MGLEGDLFRHFGQTLSLDAGSGVSRSTEAGVELLRVTLVPTGLRRDDSVRLSELGQRPSTHSFRPSFPLHLRLHHRVRLALSNISHIQSFSVYEADTFLHNSSTQHI